MALSRRALCLALSVGLAACASSLPAIEPLQVSLAGLTLGKSGRFERRLWVDLRLSNPNAFDVAIERLRFALEINEQRLGRGRLRRTVDLPAQGDVVLPVLMTVATGELVNTLMDLSSEQQVAYRLVGEAELDHAMAQRVPFEWHGRLELPRIAGAQAGGT
jgi:LEA14-like dessication related protein